MMPMFDVQGFILVGGESSRMGQDKAQLRFGGRTSVELIATALQPVTQSVTTVGWTDQASDPLPNIPDLRPGCAAFRMVRIPPVRESHEEPGVQQVSASHAGPDPSREAARAPCGRAPPVPP